MSVTRVLFRVYRPIILPFVAIIVVAEVIAATAVASAQDLGFSMWLVLGGQAAKYWLLVVGIILIAMQLRQFVVNGATRHEFLAGMAVFGLVLVVGWAVAIVLGHGIESAVLGALDKQGPDYPTFTAGGALREFGQQLPVSLAYFVSGATIAAGFYRWRAWIGLVVMVGGAVPAIVADALLGFNEWGGLTHDVPYPGALAASLAATALVAWGLHRAISDVPIRRTAG
ncbi:hypothetical protein [Paractinoplanes globisporus]|uniref:DUF4386 family protein n=1 Tax=Paractinoplanes globisporus TaxID=113565 RepID=A0ABW6WLP1_9ACTN|nr:hypothetical protein [Actinoplanes globisporus]